MKPKTILIADDSALARNKVKRMLQPDKNLTLVEAVDGQDAIVKLQQTNFDCLILDLLMPHLDGMQVLDLMREYHILTPVIVITADVQKTSVEKCKELGAMYVLHKPAQEDELKQALYNALNLA